MTDQTAQSAATGSSRRATLAEVARVAGVSKGTASVALSGDSGNIRVADRTRSRIRDAAEELGYIPDMQARGFRTRKTHQIGVIVPSLRDPIYLENIRSAHEAAWDGGYQLNFAASEWNVEHEAAICRDMLGRGVDGLITLTPASPTRWRHFEPFLERGKPVLMVHTVSADRPTSIRELERRLSTIDVEICSTIGRAVSHLIALGHRRVGLFGYDSDRKRSHAGRLSAVLPHVHEPPFDAARIAPIPADADTIEAGYRAMRDYLAATSPGERATGFHALNDNLALGALRALADAGLRVPADASLIGFNDSEACRYAVPRLSTISQTHLDLGRRAADRLIELIEQRLEPPVHERLETELILRESTAPPPETTDQTAGESSEPRTRENCL